MPTALMSQKTPNHFANFRQMLFRLSAIKIILTQRRKDAEAQSKINIFYLFLKNLFAFAFLRHQR